MLLLFATQAAMADTVVTKDGRVLNGRIIQDTDGKVILEISKYGANMQVSLDRNEVVSLKESPVFKPATKPASAPAATQPAQAAGPTSRPAEATYYLIPIKGEIGKDVQKEAIRQALRSARSRKADYVVFQIDSPGGSVGETEEILGLMAEKSKPRRVAIVNKALSSAAVLTMACPDVFMLPGATIGAAVPISSGPTPAPIEEKVLSAIRAMARSAAELGDHNTLLIQGMMDADMELGLALRDGKPAVGAGHDAATAFPGETDTKTVTPGKPPHFCWQKVLKVKGQILTLTARESADCGLARDVVEDEEDVGKILGATKWTNITGTGKVLPGGEASRKDRAKADRLAYFKEVQPQIDKIDQDLEKVCADLKAAEANKGLLKSQFDAEMASAKAQYDQGMTDAGHFAQDQSINMQNQARATYNGLVSSIQSRYQGPVLAITDTITKLSIQKKQLLDQKNKIMYAAPKFVTY